MKLKIKGTTTTSKKNHLLFHRLIVTTVNLPIPNLIVTLLTHVAVQHPTQLFLFLFHEISWSHAHSSNNSRVSFYTQCLLLHCFANVFLSW